MKLKMAGLVLMLTTQVLLGKITDVQIEPDNQNTRVIILSDAPVSYSVFARPAPPQLLIDIRNGSIDFPKGQYAVNAGGITTISVEPFEQVQMVRLVVNMSRAFNYVDAREGNNVVLTLQGTGGGARFALAGASPTAPPRTPGERPSLPKEPGVPSAKGARISLNLEDADVVTVVKAIAEYVGLNVVFGEEVKGKVTVRVENVPWKQALELVLKTVNLSYIEEDGVIRIAPPDKILSEEISKKKAMEEARLLAPPVTKVYSLEFAVAGEVSSSVKKIMTSKGQIEIDKRTNSLIVTDIPEVHNAVAKLIETLDSETPQVGIEARIMEINTSALEQMGVQWNVENLAASQVVGEISGGATEQDMPAVPTISGRTGILTSYFTLKNLIEAYENKQLARTLYDPKITAMNNTKASVLGGAKVGVTVLDQRGNPVTQMFEVGIKLDVTPHINSRNQITMDVHVEVSEIGPPVAGNIQILTNEADTRVLLENGETAVIGGLVRVKSETARSGVPFLSRIPLLGRLFGANREASEEKELVIFLTPHMVD